MKVIKPVLIVIAILAAVGAAFFFGLNKVRNGLVANYPTIKYALNGAYIEVDSSISISFLKTENEALFNLLTPNANNDSIHITAPYYGRYGIDLSSRNYRVFRDGQTIEVWLPSSKLLYSEVKFESVLVNGKPWSGDDYVKVKGEMYKQLLPILEKQKSHHAKARRNAAKALMFYFMPYKFDLKLFIDNSLQTLPEVPGVNKDVDEFIKEQFSK